jgi:hypothetical protein
VNVANKYRINQKNALEGSRIKKTLFKKKIRCFAANMV